MFKRTNVPNLGIVENMSYFLCPSCGERSDIFGTGGAQEAAKQVGVKFLGGIPLHMDIRERSDAGTPIVATSPESDEAKAYLKIAEADKLAYIKYPTFWVRHKFSACTTKCNRLHIEVQKEFS